jgi:hypothetical protein
MIDGEDICWGKIDGMIVMGWMVEDFLGIIQLSFPPLRRRYHVIESFVQL